MGGVTDTPNGGADSLIQLITSTLINEIPESRNHASYISQLFLRWYQKVAHDDDATQVESILKGVSWRLRQMKVSRSSMIDPLCIQDDLELLCSCPNYLTNELCVIYEDASYVCVDKPWDYRIDLRKHDTPSFEGEPTLASWYREREGGNSETVVRFCHQLDYATSGVLLLAKDSRACGLVGKRFTTRKVDKYYFALLLGHLDCTHPNLEAVHDNLIVPATLRESLVRSGITRDLATGWYSYSFKSRESGKKMESHDDGKLNVTLLKPLASFTSGAWLRRRDAPLVPLTLVMFKPLTGRRHQLRMTAVNLGCPILGDLRYAPLDKFRIVHENSFRMYLHAQHLSFDIGGRKYEFQTQRKAFWLDDASLIPDTGELSIDWVSEHRPPPN